MTDPLTEPAKGAPYWLKPRDADIERRHLALIETLQELVRILTEPAATGSGTRPTP